LKPNPRDNQKNILSRSKTISQIVAIAIPWLILFILPVVYFHSEINALLLLEIFAAVASLTLIFSRQKTEVSRSSLAIYVSMLTLLFLAIRATWLSCDVSTSWPVLIKYIAWIQLFFTISLVARKIEFQESLMNASIFTGILHGLLAIQEYIEAPPIPATWIDPALKEHVRTRCAGMFTDPNVFGAFLAVLFLFITVALLKAENFKKTLIAGMALFLTGIAELTTLSRGSWIALALGLSFFLLLSWKGKRESGQDMRPLLLILAVLAVIAMAGPFKYRIFSMVETKDMTIAQRSLILKGFKEGFAKIPFSGFGPHTFSQIYPRFRAVGGDYPLYAHNEILHSLVETGHLSALLLLFLFLLILWQALRKAPDSFQVAGIAAMLCLFVHNLSGFSSRILPTALLIIFSAVLSRPEDPGFKLHPFLKKVLFGSTVFAAIMTICLGSYSFYINRIMQQAYFELQAGDFNQALALFSQVEKLDPGNSVASSRKSDIFLAQKDFAKARTALIKALSANPGEALYWLKLARLQPPDQAEESYLKAIELDPASEMFRLEFARFLVGQERRQQALQQLEAALASSPGFHQVYRNYLAIEELKKELNAH
jgi:O-antigen ligase